MKVLQSYVRTLAKVLIALALVQSLVTVNATGSEEFQYDAIKTPLGRLVQFKHHRLHVHCIGSGDTTVLFEPGLGGSALEWVPIQEAISQRARACIYDRAGYAWSDPSPFPRNARYLAREARKLLQELELTESLVLVGHSYGGIIVRELAQQMGSSVAALVLIDSSHEDQFSRLEASGGKSIMPTGTNFVISPIEAPENLPNDIKRKIKAFSRMRKTYSATHAEMAEFRRSATQLKSARTTVDYPVTVVSRGLNLFTDTDSSVDRDAVWQELQNDLVSLSSDGRFVKAHTSGHHVHSDDPALIVGILDGLIDEIKKGR